MSAVLVFGESSPRRGGAERFAIQRDHPAEECQLTEDADWIEQLKRGGSHPRVVSDDSLLSWRGCVISGMLAHTVTREGEYA